MFPTEIITNLWIGCFNEIKDKEFYSKKNIQYVINCSIDLPYLKIMNNCSKYRFKISDSSEIDNNLLYKLNHSINNYLSNNMGVLIYCHSGTQCTPLLLCSYLIQYSKINIDNIIMSVQNKYSKAFLEQNNFKTALDKYEFYINNKNIK